MTGILGIFICPPRDGTKRLFQFDDYFNHCPTHSPWLIGTTTLSCYSSLLHDKTEINLLQAFNVILFEFCPPPPTARNTSMPSTKEEEPCRSWSVAVPNLTWSRITTLLEITPKRWGRYLVLDSIPVDYRFNDTKTVHEFGL
jgi:hypothetical protein